MAATHPGIDHSVLAPSVDDTFTICLANDSRELAESSASGAGSVVAAVTDVASGGIRQVGTATAAGGDVALDMINGGDAAISAVAAASSAAVLASAFADISPAVVQSGIGAGDVSLDLANNGTLLINAAASASGTHALAVAGLNNGVASARRFDEHGRCFRQDRQRWGS